MVCDQLFELDTIEPAIPMLELNPMIRGRNRGSPEFLAFTLLGPQGQIFIEIELFLSIR